MSPVQSQADEHRAKRGRLLGTAICVLIGALLAAAMVVYVSSYFYLSRRGIAEAEAYGMDGFLYVPAAEVFATEDLSGHYRRCRIYAPINWIDKNVFGGPSPIVGIIFHLS
jgi:hypothetical protein